MTMTMKERIGGMGTFSVSIELANREGTRVREIEALVDTGAAYSVFPANLLADLDVEPAERRQFEMADGRVIEMGMGEAVARVDGRSATTMVIFGDAGTGPLLGAHALEGLGLGVDPVNRELIPVTMRL